MLFEIKCRFSAKVLFSADCDSLRTCVEAGVKARADLAGASLVGADLAGASLDGASLVGANLSGAYLYGANLAGANLAGASLAGAYLADANLAGANLAGASLDGVYLADANLAGANLSGANLARANLSGANLSGANLARANLSGAYLYGANLDGINGQIRDSHELLANIAVRFDASLRPVAAMIAGRLVGCWAEYTDAIRKFFGEQTMLRLREAWSQDESWGVIERMDRYGWPKADSVLGEGEGK